MPIYEYDCDSCGSRFEAIQHINEAESVNTGSSVVCPSCRATSVHRIVSPFRVNSVGVRQAQRREARRTARKVTLEKQQADIDYLKSHEH